MATVRAPNRNFTLGIPASQITMSSPVNPVSGIIILPAESDAVAAPQCSTMCAGGSGGDGGPSSYPIGG